MASAYSLAAASTARPKGFVDHTSYDTTSILAPIERRYQLTPLGPRDASAADLQNSFSFKP